MSYTITEMISILESGVSRYHSAEIEWCPNRTYFEAWLECVGDSVDLGDGSEDNWCEEEMRYYECLPFIEEDTPVEAGEFDGTPIRTHDYHSCYMYIRVNLPENRHRGDTYTVEEIQKMVEVLSHGDDSPGSGFEYFNMPDEE
jgi:hypothetical protein